MRSCPSQGMPGQVGATCGAGGAAGPVNISAALREPQ